MKPEITRRRVLAALGLSAAGGAVALSKTNQDRLVEPGEMGFTRDANGRVDDLNGDGRENQLDQNIIDNLSGTETFNRFPYLWGMNDASNPDERLSDQPSGDRYPVDIEIKYDSEVSDPQVARTEHQLHNALDNLSLRTSRNYRPSINSGQVEIEDALKEDDAKIFEEFLGSEGPDDRANGRDIMLILASGVEDLATEDQSSVYFGEEFEAPSTDVGISQSPGAVIEATTIPEDYDRFLPAFAEGKEVYRPLYGLGRLMGMGEVNTLELPDVPGENSEALDPMYPSSIPYKIIEENEPWKDIFGSDQLVTMPVYNPASLRSLEQSYD